MTRSEQITKFVAVIWSWYSRHKRTLPWRDLQITDDTQRAYQVLVSEIMLQQTQVPRVIVSYKNFIQTFPTIKDLAVASNSQVIMAWRGMGYNNRALRLRDAARTIISDHQGKFPSDMEALQSISGIGHYTAAAIRNFAFDLPTPCLDTNIRRIIHRAFVGPENPDGTWKKNDKFLLKIAEQLLIAALAPPPRSPASAGSHPSPDGGGVGGGGRTPANWHAALMDFGSLVCTKRNPKWDICPLTKAGLMKAAYKVKLDRSAKLKKTEPGRLVGSTFIPNRIFRGRVIDALRDAPKGLQLDAIGKLITLDWSPREHRKWLRGIIDQLQRDRLITPHRGSLMLSD